MRPIRVNATGSACARSAITNTDKTQKPQRGPIQRTRVSMFPIRPSYRSRKTLM